jgi:hypothetical protein
MQIDFLHYIKAQGCIYTSNFFFYIYFLGGFFNFFVVLYSALFHLPPSDSTVPTDAGMEPRTVATCALAVRRSNH